MLGKKFQYDKIEQKVEIFVYLIQNLSKEF